MILAAGASIIFDILLWKIEILAIYWVSIGLGHFIHL